MPRIDDYRMARAKAIEELKNETFKYIVNRSGFKKVSENRMEISFLGSKYHVTYPYFEFKNKDNPKQEVPLTEQVLILHYLQGKKPLSVYDKWISYREIPGATFYFGPFSARVITPMVNVFGKNLDLFKRACGVLGALEIEEGDVGFEYYVFPFVPIRLILWEGDDEFDPSGNILFDVSISSILSPEDVAWLSGMTIYKLIEIAKTL